MPGTVTTIDRDQREGLYELVRNHLGSIEDFWIGEWTRDCPRPAVGIDKETVRVILQTREFLNSGD